MRLLIAIAALLLLTGCVAPLRVTQSQYPNGITVTNITGSCHNKSIEIITEKGCAIMIRTPSE